MATAPLVSIPNIKSVQIVNGTTVPLIDGTLQVTEPLASSRGETHAKLYITLKEGEHLPAQIPGLDTLDADDKPSTTRTEESPSGADEEETEKRPPRELLIPLFEDSFVGSKGGEGLVWRFDLPEKELGIVEVRFDEDTDSELALQFEKVMVYNGLLKTGIVQDADDFSRTIREAAAGLGAKLGMKTTERNDAKQTEQKEGEEQGGERTEFSDITKSVVGGVETGTSKAAKVTSDIGSFVSRAAFNAGAWVSEKTGLGKNSNNNGGDGGNEEDKSLPREALGQALEGAEVATENVGAGIKNVGSAIGESASKVAEHDHGEEAKGLVDQGRTAGANVGQMGVDVITRTSIVYNAGAAGAGAAKATAEGGEAKVEEPDKDLKVVSPKPIEG